MRAEEQVRGLKNLAHRLSKDKDELLRKVEALELEFKAFRGLSIKTKQEYDNDIKDSMATIQGLEDYIAKLEVKLPKTKTKKAKTNKKVAADDSN